MAHPTHPWSEPRSQPSRARPQASNRPGTRWNPANGSEGGGPICMETVPPHRFYPVASTYRNWSLSPPFSRAVESNGDCNSDFFGAERSVAESGGVALGCSCPRWQRQFRWLWHFRRLWQLQWWASSSRVSLFDLGGYLALMAVFFGWSRASSSRVSAAVAGFSAVCVSAMVWVLYCCGVLGGSRLGGELLTLLNTCIVFFMKSIVTIWLGDFHLKDIFVARCIDLRMF
jgi:hypothetical protein